MTETTYRPHAVAAVLAPPALLAAFALHPHIAGRLPNDSAVAHAVADGPAIWGLAHVLTAVASGFVALAFIAVRGYLRDHGGDRWSGFGLPFIVIGSMLYAFLPGMEFAPLAAVEAGGDAEAAQAALTPWFLPVLMGGALVFAVGVVGFAKGIAGLDVLGPRLTALIVVALIVFAASRFVPLFVVQGYVQVAAALLALWPLAQRMWNSAQAPMPGTLRTATASH